MLRLIDWCIGVRLPATTRKENNMEAWRQYGGFYRLVDFTTSWTYDTPPIETRTLTTLPIPPTEPITPITSSQPISPIAVPSLEQPSPLLSNFHDAQGDTGSTGADSSWRHSVLRPIVSLPDTSPSPGNSSERNARSAERVGDLELDDIGLGLQMGPEINTGNYDDNDLTSYSYGGGGGMGGIGLELLGLEAEATLDSPGSSQFRSRQVQSMATVEVPMTTATRKERKKTFRLVKKWFSSGKSRFVMCLGGKLISCDGSETEFE
ncbi:hypothetical protein M378DRAFT_1007835 [Amanita muscaria Koide BX008]|uniref:Uncharacterized protein n=1 Tax=Amanita muscaria (strain Koide BX008) TaxID=946122 RepID=A0A0C2WSR3_AMAMK|nr:hypothetical protein M378DRAFT_1007835 [Amanita muscaria Koide BX008]